MRWWLAASLLPGCAYRVALSSAPQPAEVVLPGGGIVTTPTEVRLRWVPVGHQWVEVRAPGHRPLLVDLRRSEIKGYRYLSDTLWRPGTLAGDPRGEVRFQLVPEHGPVGTWGPEEIP